jgi:corrinoid protein of di/trimethylamine methyltransferase
MIMSDDVLENLKKAILDYDKKEASHLAVQTIQEKINPLRAVEAMTSAIKQVGDGFEEGRFFLPDLVGAADAMSAAMTILEEELNKTGTSRDTLGTIVIGTVYGDIHTIGKTMVATMLTAEGFTVYDLGINVTAEQFIHGIKEHRAGILAMSALLSTTAQEQRKVMRSLETEGLRKRLKIMVGGGAVTQEFADDIGADGYDPTAPGAAKLARELVGR